MVSSRSVLEDVASRWAWACIDILSRVELELGDDAGEMRPHGRSRD